MTTSAKEQTSLKEHDVLIDAATDFGRDGSTSIKCPRCGNDIILVQIVATDIIKCASENCISASFRGI